MEATSILISGLALEAVTALIATVIHLGFELPG